MLKNRIFTSLISTICLYALLGLPFFYLFNKTIGTEQKPQEKTISFSLVEYIPPVIPPIVTPPVEEIIEPEPIEPEPPEEVEEEPVVEEPIVEEVIPEPVKKIPKPIVKKIVKPKPVIKKKKVSKPKVKKKPKRAVKKRVHQQRKKAQTRKSASPAKQKRFFNQLRARINKNKTYPRIAQRRGMQGSVKVRFSILKNGRVGNISVSGSKVFHASAKAAVRKSFPISTKNAPVSLPTTVNFTLRYQMR